MQKPVVEPSADRLITDVFDKVQGGTLRGVRGGRHACASACRWHMAGAAQIARITDFDQCPCTARHDVQPQIEALQQRAQDEMMGPVIFGGKDVQRRSRQTCDRLEDARRIPVQSMGR